MTQRRTPSPSLGLKATIRQLSAQPALSAVIAVTILTTAFLVASAPPMVEGAIAEDLLATVKNATPVQRNLTVEQSSGYPAADGSHPFEVVADAGHRFASQVPPTLGSVITGSSFLVESAQFGVTPVPPGSRPHPFPTFLSFRYQQDIQDHITLSRGRLPRPSQPVTMAVGSECPTSPEGIDSITKELGDKGPIEGLDCRLESLPHFEIGVTSDTADAMGYAMDRLMLVQPDPEDRLFLGVSGAALRYQFLVSISGIIELDDPTLDYWGGDPTLHRPSIQQNADLRIIRATGLISPYDYASLMQTLGGASWRYTWRLFVGPELVAEAPIEAMTRELPAFELKYSPVAVRPQDFRVLTGLDDLLSRHLEQRSHTSEAVSLAVAGLIASMTMAILLLGALMSDRQRAGLALARSRGASSGQIILSRTYQGLMLAVPSALGGLLLARALSPAPDRAEIISIRWTIVVIAFALLVIVVSGVLALRAGPDPALRGEPRTRLSARIVFEALVIALAAGGLILLVRRSGTETNVDTGIDLLLVMTPPLLALAVGMLSLHIYPWLIEGLARLGSRLPGPTLMLGLRRIVESHHRSRLPILVLIVCLSTAVAASSTRASLEADQEAASWLQVGADFTVKGSGDDSPLPTSVDLEDIGAIDDIVLARAFPEARAVADSRSVETTVVGIDSEGYARLTADTPGDIRFPAEMMGSVDEGTADDPIPVIVSDRWPGRVDLARGDTFTLDLGRLEPSVRVAEIRERFPDTPEETPFVIVPLADLETLSDLPLPPTVAYIRADVSAGPELARALADQSDLARLSSRYDLRDVLRNDPLIAWAGIAFRAVTVSSVVLAMVAVAAAMALSSGARRRDFGYLRTMGLEISQTTAMTVLEFAPPLLFAVLVGAMTGVWTVNTVLPMVDLGPLTGDAARAAVSVNWDDIALIATGLAAGLVVGVVIFAILSSRDHLGRLLREAPE